MRSDYKNNLLTKENEFFLIYKSGNLKTVEELYRSLKKIDQNPRNPPSSSGTILLSGQKKGIYGCPRIQRRNKT